MTAITFEVSSAHVMIVKGGLTRDAIPPIWKKWHRVIQSAEIRRVDVTDVDNVDTAGVALLLELVKAQQLDSIPCVGANTQLQQIAAVSGVEGVLSLS